MFISVITPSGGFSVEQGYGALRGNETDLEGGKKLRMQTVSSELDPTPKYSASLS